MKVNLASKKTGLSAWELRILCPAKEGFTLIELLAVIAVIAVIAAMLLPCLSRARLKAETTVCINNQRQLQIGMILYVQETGFYPNINDRVPALLPFVRTDWPSNNYAMTLNEGDPFLYLGTRSGIYACPGYNRVRGWFEPGNLYYGSCYGSYGFNAIGMGGGGLGPYDDHVHPPLDPATKDDEVLVPSDMVCWGDASLRAQAMPVTGDVDYQDVWLERENFALVLEGQSHTDITWAVQEMKQRHGGRWIAAFCDGHVENLRPEALFNQTNSAVMSRWNRNHQPVENTNKWGPQ
ncbi:MAG TPA: prepilin-type N-terminal cleavage/methylation domain-containing protein [Verrucomicrobiae bacterium]|nr:prepilin-type N-terminal cleavage/methylation domain-containing protein [Verrucomicrobiae bacterium]